MRFEIVPKFGEIQLFIFSVSVILIAILYGDILGFTRFVSFFASFVMESPFAGIIGLMAIMWVLAEWLYGLFLSMKFAISKEIPSPQNADRMVRSVLIPLTALSMIAAFELLSDLSYSQNILDRIIVIFPIVEFIRCLIVLGMARIHQIEFRKKFDYKNATKEEVIAAFVVLLIAGFAFRFLTAYSPALVILIMYEMANIEAYVARTIYSTKLE